jgi:hypothetical protein
VGVKSASQRIYVEATDVNDEAHTWSVALSIILGRWDELQRAGHGSPSFSCPPVATRQAVVPATPPSCTCLLIPLQAEQPVWRFQGSSSWDAPATPCSFSFCGDGACGESVVEEDGGGGGEVAVLRVGGLSCIRWWRRDTPNELAHHSGGAGKRVRASVLAGGDGDGGGGPEEGDLKGLEKRIGRLVLSIHYRGHDGEGLGHGEHRHGTGEQSRRWIGEGGGAMRDKAGGDGEVLTCRRECPTYRHKCYVRSRQISNV